MQLCTFSTQRSDDGGKTRHYNDTISRRVVKKSKVEWEAPGTSRKKMVLEVVVKKRGSTLDKFATTAPAAPTR